MDIINIFDDKSKEMCELNKNMELSLYIKFFNDLVSNFHMAPLFELEPEIKKVCE
jgi:hypothetical protein